MQLPNSRNPLRRPAEVIVSALAMMAGAPGDLTRRRVVIQPLSTGTYLAAVMPRRAGDPWPEIFADLEEARAWALGVATVHGLVVTEEGLADD